MLLKLPKSSQISLLAITTLLIGNLLMQSSQQISSDLKLISMLVDWAICIPLLIYYGLHRFGYFKNISIKLVFWLAIFSAMMLTNDQSLLKQALIQVYPYLIAVIATVMFMYSIIKITIGWQLTKGLSAEQRIHSIARYCYGKGKLAQLIASEWLGLYYLFFGWSKAAKLKNNQFSYHNHSSMKSVLITVSLLTLLEMFVLHLLIQLWSVNIAWLITGISLYFLYVVPAQLNAMKHRPVCITNKKLLLRNGIIISADIPHKDILSVNLISPFNNTALEKTTLRAQLFDTANILIQLKQSQRVPLIAGFSKNTNTIALFLDQPKDFITQIESKLNPDS